MKLILCLFIGFSYISNAASQDILKCLGQEEKLYHKKRVGGAMLKINKDLIGEMLQISSTLDIKANFKEEICSTEKYTPSIKLLKLLLREKENLFVFKSPPGDVIQRSQDQSAIDELVTKSAFLLIKLINHIQSEFKQPNCIEKELPSVRFFYKATRYTLEERGIEKILPHPGIIDAIFEKLFSDELRQKCKA